MKELYEISGISKQSLYKYRLKLQKEIKEKEQVKNLMEKYRKEHKRMSCRKIYFREKEKSNICFGRDRFEKIAFSLGYKVRQKRNVMKTTWGQRVNVYPDLVTGTTINNINQVFQCDIFYLKIGNKNYYAVTIVDIYSRVLLSLHISTSLQAKEIVKAIKKLLKSRDKKAIEFCIFHTDTGSQFISKEVQDLLKSLNMRQSMCDIAQKNAYVERLQGILKYEYLFENNLTDRNIHSITRKIIKLYNEERPHLSLKNKTPIEYEAYINQLNDDKRPKMKVYDWN